MLSIRIFHMKTWVLTHYYYYYSIWDNYKCMSITFCLLPNANNDARSITLRQNAKILQKCYVANAFHCYLNIFPVTLLSRFLSFPILRKRRGEPQYCILCYTSFRRFVPKLLRVELVSQVFLKSTLPRLNRLPWPR